MLFSATQTRKIEDLARISLKNEPLYIGVDDQKDKATVEGLEQVGSSALICSHNEKYCSHCVSIYTAVYWLFKFYVLVYCMSVLIAYTIVRVLSVCLSPCCVSLLRMGSLT